MKSNKKTGTLKSLNILELTPIIKEIIQKSGYVEIKAEDGFISGQINTGLAQDNHLFIIYDYSLSGKTKAIEYTADIKQRIESLKPSNIFIISNSLISNNSRNKLEELLPNYKMVFWDVDYLLTLIDRHIPDYWHSSDINLLKYEDEFLKLIDSSNDLKKLKIFNEKYNEILNFFIEPTLMSIIEDKETSIPIRKKARINDLTTETKNIILTGEAGSGKSTVLKKIGELMIKSNREGNDNVKKIPIIIYPSDIQKYDFNIEKLLNDKIDLYFEDRSHKEFIFLFDSIDEFDQYLQESIINLIELKDSFRYIIATRNSEKFTTLTNAEKTKNYFIVSFNDKQILKFINSFFGESNIKAKKLIDSLKDQRVLEKLPMSPLTLSLISMLFDESDYEIPATITDIYENFSSLLLGKLTISQKFQLIGVSYRERILSIYALEIIQTNNFEYFTHDELVEYFKDYFNNKRSPVKNGSIEDLIGYLVENTGILHIDKNNKIAFRHDSFLEYYAALEIFKHRRELEYLLVENFFDFHWQNSAIFYAGMSKDLPLFLNKINDKVLIAQNIEELFSSVLGIGYLLQSMYQTDDNLRSKSIDIALSKNIEAYEILNRATSLNKSLSKYNIPMLMLINTFYFYENFNSITLKSPLEISYRNLLNDNGDIIDSNSVYKAINLAITLSSKRIGEYSYIENLVNDKLSTSHPVYTALLYISLDIFDKKNYEKYKKEINDMFRKQKKPISHLLKTPASKLRLTNYDIISSKQRITLIVEGKTDGLILEHAYMTLYNGALPPWNIEVAGNNDNSGGASEVYKTLMACKPTLKKDQIVIGIFDRDAKGCQEFNGLKKNVFQNLSDNLIKKHTESEIYAICLPVPEHRVNYIHKDQNKNFLEIEHYFSNEYIESINGFNKSGYVRNQEEIFEINDRSKAKILDKVLLEDNIEVFEHFKLIFDLIDNIISKV